MDGQAIGSGLGGDLLGHPLDALAWLASHTSKRGLTRRAGEVAILDSRVISKFPLPGQRFEFALEGFAPIELFIDEAFLSRTRGCRLDLTIKACLAAPFPQRRD